MLLTGNEAVELGGAFLILAGFALAGLILVMLPAAIVLGIMAGYFRGWIDDAIQYLYTTLNSIPGVLLIAALWLYLAQDVPPQVESYTLLWCIALGVFGFTTMTLTVQYGVTHMPVHRSAVILLFEVVVGAVSSMLLTDELMTTREWLGGLLVMLAAYLSAFIPDEAVVERQGS